MNALRIIALSVFATAGILMILRSLYRLPESIASTPHAVESQAGKAAPRTIFSNALTGTAAFVSSENMATSELPPAIAKALSNSWRIPFGITEADVHSVTEGAILSSLAIQSSPSNRVAHLSILDEIGGDQSAAALIHMLTDEFTGGVLSVRDYYAMIDAVYSLGCISARSALAKEFLERAITEEFWTQNRGWLLAPQSPQSDDAMNFWLATECLKSLGVGGHDEALKLAEQFRESSFEVQAKWSSAVVDTMFFLDRAKLKPGPRLPEDGEAMVAEFFKWGETERAKPWKKWSQSIREAQTPPAK
jgi:hypothetical protein